MSMPSRPSYARVLLAAGAVTTALLSPILGTAPASAGLACNGPLPPIPIVDDCTAPTTVLTAKPAASAASRVAGFAFGVAGNEPLGVDFSCRLVGPAQAHDWRPCTDDAPFGTVPQTGSSAYTNLALGTYTFSVRATDRFLLGPNTEDPPVTWTWEVVATDPGTDPDPGAPQTTITAAPSRWLLTPFTEVRFEGDEELATAQCTLNGVTRKCSRSSAVLTGMGPRDYTFAVAGIDVEGDVDATPATASWTLPYAARDARLSQGWQKKTGSGYYQDAYATTTTRGATLTKARSGFRSVVLVATRLPRGGKVAVSLGGKTLKTVDLAAGRTQKRRVIPVASWSKPQRGTVKVTVLTKGRTVVLEGIGLSTRP